MRSQRIVLLFVVIVFAPGLPNVSALPAPSVLLNHFVFREIGPTRQGGRVVAVSVSRQDPQTFLVAAGPAGVWKTVNNGTTFEPVFDHEDVASIGDVAVAPSNDNIVWVGTGEANLRNSTYYGKGVFRSLDGGESWEHMGLLESHHIGRVLIHPENPEIVYVAAQGHLYTENPERGVYKTTDGGKSWTKSLEVVIEGRHIGATEVIMSPDDPNTLYAVAYDRMRMPWSFRTAGPGSGIHKSTDAGKSWRKLENGLPGGMLGKIGIDIYLRNPRILYATIDNANSPGVSDDVRRSELFDGKRASRPTVGHGIYRSDDAGESWRRVSKEGESIGNRSNYYGQIIVDPNDEDHLYVLSSRVDVSADGGKTWTLPIRYGGDNHVLWIDPADSRHMIMGYDYGMAITHDAGAQWYHPDELSMAQLYAVGIDMDYPYNVYGGTQDFGSWKGPSTKKGRFPIRFEDWEHMNGGDGFYNQVDPTDSRWLYSGSQFGHIQRIDQKTGVRKTVLGDRDSDRRFNWNTPLLISPHNSDVLYVGANVLLRSPFRGERWETVSPDLTKNDSSKYRGVGAVSYGTITTVDESPIEQGVLWVGTDDGNVQLSKDGGETWADLNGNVPDNPGYWVTRVTASHHDVGTAYLSFTGLRRDDFRPFVYKTTDFGKSWISIASNLPQQSVNVIKEDRKNPDLLFVGTDGGVYASLDGGGNWVRMKNNIPTVAVHDLVIHPRENDLVVGTHGRGFYITDISPLQELTQELLVSDVHLFEIEPQVQWVMPSQPAVSAQNFEGENQPHGVVVNYYSKGERPDGVSIRIYDGTRLINEIKGSGAAGLNSVEWGMTKRRERTSKEIERWEEWDKESADEEEFFDYYDTVDFYGAPDEEVDKWGRSLQTRVHAEAGITERDYAYFRVAPGEYTVELWVDGTVLRGEAVILQDHWYDK